MEDKQNLNSIVGIALIFMLLMLWMSWNKPKSENIPQPTTPTEAAQTTNAATTTAPAAAVPLSDSVQNLQLLGKLADFAPSGHGEEVFPVLENDLVKVTFNSKGGTIKEVFLKKYFKINVDSAGNDIKSPVRLLEDAKNRFEMLIPVKNAAGGQVSTSDLYFTHKQEGNNKIVFAATGTNGLAFEQSYELAPNNYTLDYKVNYSGLQNTMPAGQNSLRFNWVNYLDKLEKNQSYERNYSSVYYKVSDENSDFCKCTANDIDNLGGKSVDWIGHSNQFFNSSMIAGNIKFTNFIGETVMFTDKEDDLKLLKSSADIPLQNPASGTVAMTLYSGPNEFERMKSMGNHLEDIIPFGSSIFGTINRWFMHPVFDFMIQFIGNKGIVILLLTLFIKLLVFPLSYKMIHSQARMSALKPQIEALKKKHGDDQQALSMETMKMYSEFGVNPLGGCFPVLLQMPIWFALYRFFPAAIEFRQAGFLWATDLSSYDVAFRLPFSIPAYGNHVSLFTLIWVATTLWYTWYSMKQMDTSTMMNPAMKYMQYFMPIMFLFFFNNFASGLSCYLSFSNLINIGQTILTKQYLINHDKIRDKLEENRKKPKKTSGWREKFESALKEQQRLADEKLKAQQKKK